MKLVQLRGNHLWDQPCLAYNVHAQFDAHGAACLADLQARVIERSGSSLRATPPHAFHVSIFPMIPVSWPSREKGSMWARLEKQTRDVLAAETDRELTICFVAVEVTPTAVILSTTDQPGPIGRLREQPNAVRLAAGLPKQSFDRTHVTLARPTGDVMLNALTVDGIQSVPAHLELRVHAIRLVRETVYPSLRFEVLA